jgi:hypothetical protein
MAGGHPHHGIIGDHRSFAVQVHDYFREDTAYAVNYGHHRLDVRACFDDEGYGKGVAAKVPVVDCLFIAIFET